MLGIDGPADSPYAGGTFKVEVNVPDRSERKTTHNKEQAEAKRKGGGWGVGGGVHIEHVFISSLLLSLPLLQLPLLSSSRSLLDSDPPSEHRQWWSHLFGYLEHASERLLESIIESMFRTNNDSTIVE